jgi:hypothetical protein
MPPGGDRAGDSLVPTEEESERRNDMKRMNRQAAALCLFLLLFVLFLALPAAAQDEMLEQLAPQSWID